MIRKLLEKRAKLVADARAILDAAEAEERGLTAEESQTYDELMDEAADVKVEIERRERIMAAEADLDGAVDDPSRPDPDADAEPERIEFRSQTLQGLSEGFPEWQEQEEYRATAERSAPEFRQAFRSYLRGGADTPETRALQVGSDTGGGYLVTPIQFVDRLIQAVDNAVFMRGMATIFPLANADSLGAPSLDNDPANPTWTSEILIGSEDSTMSFGRRELKPHPLAQYIKVSRKLLRLAPDAEDLVIRRLAYKFAVVAENAYLNGDGAGQPLGVFTAGASGISTSRDVSTGNTTTEIRFDGLIECKYTLKAQYWPRAAWIFHRDGVKQAAKLKDGNGQYLWRESVRVGEPDRILSFPVYMSEYAPNTFTTGLYVGILGDFSQYWITDALDFEVQRLVELMAATNQIGFIGRLESDGMPVLEEAFARVKLA
jgi:HK97 family phage major capsid protein